MLNLTFSPYDPKTRQLKSNIVVAFVRSYALTSEEYDKGYINYKGHTYTLVCLSDKSEHFNLFNIWSGNVSFQRHTTGNYAIVA